MGDATRNLRGSICAQVLHVPGAPPGPAVFVPGGTLPRVPLLGAWGLRLESSNTHRGLSPCSGLLAEHRKAHLGQSLVERLHGSAPGSSNPGWGTCLLPRGTGYSAGREPVDQGLKVALSGLRPLSVSGVGQYAKAVGSFVCGVRLAEDWPRARTQARTRTHTHTHKKRVM